MVSIQIKSRVAADGILYLEIPTQFRETAVEACIVLQPVATPVSGTVSGWPQDFFERTSGQWQGDLERGEQGIYEAREAL